MKSIRLLLALLAFAPLLVAIPAPAQAPVANAPRPAAVPETDVLEERPIKPAPPVLLVPSPGNPTALDLNAAGLPTPEVLERYVAQLGIQGAQMEMLAAIYDDAREEAGPLEERLRTTGENLQTALLDPALSEEAAAARLTENLKAEADLKHLRLRTLLRLRAGLTPAQQQQLRSLGPDIPATVAGPSLQEKAEKLKAAVESVIGTTTPGMKAVGRRIKSQLDTGDTARAEMEIDALLTIFTAPAPVIDFASQPTGDTDTGRLLERYETLTEWAKDIEDMRLLREVAVARDALETAKTNGDAAAAGRILSWAEGKKAAGSR